MKSILKIVSIFIVKLFYTIKWLVLVFIKTDGKNHIPKVHHAGILTILANGPSLKDDLDKLDYTQGDFSVVNFFYDSPYFKIVKPRYYVVMDPQFFYDDHKIRPIIESVDWDMKLYVPYYTSKNVKLLRNMPNKHIEVIPCNLVPYNGFECLRYSVYQHGLAIPRLQNVLVASIFTGINMGYKEIKLYGVDHSWLGAIRVNDNNEVCLLDSHFYDTQEVKLRLFHKASGEPYKMHEALRDFAQMFDGYHQLRKYADFRGCKIVNCTKGSFIDAFERESVSL